MAELQTSQNPSLRRRRSFLSDGNDELAEPLSKRLRAFDGDGGGNAAESQYPELQGAVIDNVPEQKAADGSEEQGGSKEPEKPKGSIKSRMSLARDILKRYFDFDDFKSEQEGVIKTLLAGENSLAVLPTNAGKSLCYQLPALYFEEFDKKYGTNEEGKHGITLVISPLISLMTDQVTALRKKNIAADAINTSKSAGEVRAVLNSLTAGKLKILFCAPEKFMNEAFVQAILTVPGGVRLLAIDEAHCIAEVVYYHTTIAVNVILTNPHSGATTSGRNT